MDSLPIDVLAAILTATVPSAKDMYAFMSCSGVCFAATVATGLCTMIVTTGTNYKLSQLFANISRPVMTKLRIQAHVAFDADCFRQMRVLHLKVRIDPYVKIGGT